MIRAVFRIVFGIPILIIGVVLVSAGAETGVGLLGWPIIVIALLIMLLGSMILWKAWKALRGG